MIRYRASSPILQDAQQGSPTGQNTGLYVMNDGESAPVHYEPLLQANRFPILQANGDLIYLVGVVGTGT
jgi:hypothetical protein